MTDVFTTEKRSQVMAHIRGRGNRNTELVLLRIFRLRRITGWRRHLPLAGRPDFAFPKARIAIFIDGCFWHRCPRCSNLPANNREFWELKLQGNVVRDRRVTRELRRSGWRVIRVWEHSLRDNPGRMRVLGALRRALSEASR